MTLVFKPRSGTVVIPAKSCKEYLDNIKVLAIARWGEDETGYGTPRWHLELVRAYVAVESQVTGEEIKAVTRRSQIMRALETGGCTADTLLMLYAALDCRLDVVQEQRMML